MQELGRIARDTPGVEHTMSIAGQSFLLNTNSSNFGSLFVILKPFDDRRQPDLTANAIMDRLRKEFAAKVRDAQVGVFGAPPVPGIGMAAGFKLMIEDRGSLGLNQLQASTDALVDSSGQRPHMIVMPTVFRSNTPQLFMDIDRTKVESLGLTLDQVNQTLQIYLGSYYVNNFNEFGRYWQMNIQADGQYRREVDNLNQLFVRNKTGDMVPLGTLIRMREIGGPVMITRYNLYSAAPIMGGGKPPLSSGQTINLMEEESAKALPG